MGGGGLKGVEDLEALPQEKKNQSFKLECLKWPILAEMTAKQGKYFHFFCQQGGDISPVVLKGGSPGGNPVYIFF